MHGNASEEGTSKFPQACDLPPTSLTAIRSRSRSITSYLPAAGNAQALLPTLSRLKRPLAKSAHSPRASDHACTSSNHPGQGWKNSYPVSDFRHHLQARESCYEKHTCLNYKSYPSQIHASSAFSGGPGCALTRVYVCSALQGTYIEEVSSTRPVLSPAARVISHRCEGVPRARRFSQSRPHSSRFISC
jgi:hypothetical protein